MKAPIRNRGQRPAARVPASLCGVAKFSGCGAAAADGKGLTLWRSSTIVRAMNGQNLICGICREIIR